MGKMFGKAVNRDGRRKAAELVVFEGEMRKCRTFLADTDWADTDADEFDYDFLYEGMPTKVM